MKAIINGLLYDTDKADVVCRDDFGFLTVYKTKNKRIFIKDARQVTSELLIIDENEVRDMIGFRFPDKYIELFGEVEEA